MERGRCLLLAPPATNKYSELLVLARTEGSWIVQTEWVVVRCEGT